MLQAQSYEKAVNFQVLQSVSWSKAMCSLYKCNCVLGWMLIISYMASTFLTPEVLDFSVFFRLLTLLDNILGDLPYHITHQSCQVSHSHVSWTLHSTLSFCFSYIYSFIESWMFVFFNLNSKRNIYCRTLKCQVLLDHIYVLKSDERKLLIWKVKWIMTENVVDMHTIFWNRI